MPVIYTATATTSGGGREGLAETSDGKISLQLAFPKEVGGNGSGTNPEQLVSLGYSACFGSALALVAGKHKISAATASTTCHTHLHKENEGFHLTFDIEVELPGVERTLAQQIVTEAHQTCPYSKAFRDGATSTAKLKSA
jgi:Ohr subfamily peroxiredoxin